MESNERRVLQLPVEEIRPNPYQPRRLFDPAALEELADYPADMFCTVFIGNSTTRVIGGRLVTPRGYRHG